MDVDTIRDFIEAFEWKYNKLACELNPIVAKFRAKCGRKADYRLGLDSISLDGTLKLTMESERAGTSLFYVTESEDPCKPFKLVGGMSNYFCPLSKMLETEQRFMATAVVEQIFEVGRCVVGLPKDSEKLEVVPEKLLLEWVVAGRGEEEEAR